MSTTRPLITEGPIFSKGMFLTNEFLAILAFSFNALSTSDNVLEVCCEKFNCTISKDTTNTKSLII